MGSETADEEESSFKIPQPGPRLYPHPEDSQDLDLCPSRCDHSRLGVPSAGRCPQRILAVKKGTVQPKLPANICHRRAEGTPGLAGSARFMETSFFSQPFFPYSKLCLYVDRRVKIRKFLTDSIQCSSLCISIARDFVWGPRSHKPWFRNSKYFRTKRFLTTRCDCLQIPQLSVWWLLAVRYCGPMALPSKRIWISILRQHSNTALIGGKLLSHSIELPYTEGIGSRFKS